MLFCGPFQSDKRDDKTYSKNLIDSIIYCIKFTIALFTFICYNLVV